MTTLRELTEKLLLSEEKLHIYQAELEAQNEDLKNMQVVLEESKKKYFDLYELAPVGYVTVYDNGLIKECNLTFTTMVNRPRNVIINSLFINFIYNPDHHEYYLTNRKLSISRSVACNLHLVKLGAVEPVYVHLDMVTDNTHERRIIISHRESRIDDP
jgi:hypothetical protein